MKVYKKTYRRFSALVLILFLNSLVLPAGLSAASLYCSMTMEMGGGASGTHNCFGAHSSERPGDLWSSDKEACSYQQICKEAVSLQEEETQAILQVTKDAAAVLCSTDAAAQLFNYLEITISPPESNAANTTPPIFLLNSVFLN